MQKFPLAERLATEVTIQEADDVETALGSWRASYISRVGSEPGPEEAGAAKAVLARRLRGEIPPPPPSASSSSWKIPPPLEIGVPNGDAGKKNR